MRLMRIIYYGKSVDRKKYGNKKYGNQLDKFWEEGN